MVRQNFHLLYFALGFSCTEPEALFISLKTFFSLIFAWKISRTICWKIWWIKGKANAPLASAQEVLPLCFMLYACLKILPSAKILYNVNAELELNLNCFDSASPLRKQVKLPFYSIWPFMFYRFLVSLPINVWFEQKHHTLPSHSIVLCVALNYLMVNQVH